MHPTPIIYARGCSIACAYKLLSSEVAEPFLLIHKPFESESSKIFLSQSRVTGTVELLRVIDLQDRDNLEPNKINIFKQN